LEHFIDLLVNELGMCEGRWLVGARQSAGEEQM
jgi:hypothetical protein